MPKRLLHCVMPDIETVAKTTEIHHSSIAAANVASVPQRSPLRYPGGKTWLIPHIRMWLRSFTEKPSTLVEPFAGGGVVSLTAVMEDLVENCLLIELDEDVAAFWKATLDYGDTLIERILGFTPTTEAVRSLESQVSKEVVEQGFRTLVLNRTRRGGILAPGASLIKKGEAGKGLTSRWYPETIGERLRAIREHSDRIKFREMDGMDFLANILKESREGNVFFVDPPYTAEGKRAGNRLYGHNKIDHPRLFKMLADGSADFLMTYDLSREIVALVEKYGFHAVQVTMKNTHHDRIPELVITSRPVFCSEGVAVQGKKAQGEKQ